MSPRMLQTFVVLAFVVCATQAQAGNFFICRRPGQDCGDTGTCSLNGTTCNCNPGNQQVKYTCLKSNIQAKTCTLNTCQNGGDCFVNMTSGVNSGEFCVCDQTWTGDKCRKRRFQTSCSSDTGMMVTVIPYGTFTGVMYAQDYSTDPQCTMTSSGNGVYNKTFAFDTCGMQSLMQADGSLKYTLRVIVQYSTAAVTPTDQRLYAICVFNSSNVIEGGLPSSINGSLDNLDQGMLSVEAEIARSLQLRILDAQGKSLDSSSPAVTVGTPLELEIILKNNPVFQHLMVQECVASNRANASLAEYASMPVVINTCPADNVLVNGNHTAVTVSGGRGVRIPVLAILFVNGSNNGRQNELHFRCSIRLCPNATDEECRPMNTTFCMKAHNEIFTSALGRRRRRSTPNFIVNTNSTATVEGAVTVIFTPSEQQVQIEETPPSSGECLKVPQMQIFIVILFFIILVLLITLFALANLLCRRRKRHPKKAFDESSTSSLRMTYYSDPIFPTGSRQKIMY